MNSPFEVPDIKTLVEERKEQLKNPHFLDQARTVKNDAPGDAIANVPIPSTKEEYQLAENITKLFETVSRPGQLNFRDNPASQILENAGQYEGKPKTEYDDNALPDASKQSRVSTKRVRVAIYDRCMDCMQPVPTDDVWPNLCWVPDYTEVIKNPPKDMDIKRLMDIKEEQAKWQGIGLRPGDGLGWLYHKSCMDKRMSELAGISQRWGQKAAQLEARRRGKEIQEKVFDYLRNERMKPFTDVYHDEMVS